MAGRIHNGSEADALESMVKNVDVFLIGARTQLKLLTRALKDPNLIEKRRVRIKSDFMDKINSALEQLQELESEGNGSDE